ncbi:MAG: signal peptidase I [Candidatus Acidiferrales bacterium]|jgi:signal peptidase I
MGGKTQREGTDRAETTRRQGTTLTEYLESLLVTVILALFGTSFVVQAFKIPSQSMERTLLVGDHLLVNKFIFGGRGAWYDKLLPYRVIHRGDIIVFRFPYQDHPHYVKRVIGLPGDRVKIVDQRVFVNDQLLSEPYVVHDPGASYDIFMDNFPPPKGHLLPHNLQPEWADQLQNHVRGDDLVVPPEHYFVMGDNRDRSWDSRYWGFVDRNAIMGRPVLIYWSIEADSSDYSADTSLWSRLTGMADTLVHLPTRTRWSRMFHLVH